MDENVLFGAIAGICSRMTIAPLDVVKIKLQLDRSEKYRNVLNTVKTVFKEDGITGFWRGNVPALYLYGMYSAIQFKVYETMKKEMPDLYLNSFLSGGVAGTVSTICTYPFDLLRTRQCQNHKPLLKQIFKIYSQEGVCGFYKGLTPTIIQIFPFIGTVFLTHKVYLDTISKHKTPNDNFIAGGLAGITGKLVCSPLDVIRRRMQVYDESLLKCAINIYKEGFRTFYKGLSVSILKAAPSSAVTFYVFSYLKKSFSK